MATRTKRGLGFYCEVEEDDEESECLELRDGVKVFILWRE